jgi:hypothetical protein
MVVDSILAALKLRRLANELVVVRGFGHPDDLNREGIHNYTP